MLDRRRPLRLVGWVYGLSVKRVRVLDRDGVACCNAKATGSYLAVLKATVVRAVALGLGLPTPAVVVVGLGSTSFTVWLLVDGWGVSSRGRAVGCRIGGVGVLVPLPTLD